MYISNDNNILCVPILPIIAFYPSWKKKLFTNEQLMFVKIFKYYSYI